MVEVALVFDACMFMDWIWMDLHGFIAFMASFECNLPRCSSFVQQQHLGYGCVGPGSWSQLMPLEFVLWGWNRVW